MKYFNVFQQRRIKNKPFYKLAINEDIRTEGVNIYPDESKVTFYASGNSISN